MGWISHSGTVSVPFVPCFSPPAPVAGFSIHVITLRVAALFTSSLTLLPSALLQEKIWHCALSPCPWCCILGMERFCFDNSIFSPLLFHFWWQPLCCPSKGAVTLGFHPPGKLGCSTQPTPSFFGSSWVQHPHCVQQLFPPISQTMPPLSAFRVGVCRGKTAQKRDGSHMKSYLAPK